MRKKKDCGPFTVVDHWGPFTVVKSSMCVAGHIMNGWSQLVTKLSNASEAAYIWVTALGCDESKTIIIFIAQQPIFSDIHVRTLVLTCAGCGSGRGWVLKVFLPKVEITLWNLDVRVSCMVEEEAAFFFVLANVWYSFLSLFHQKDREIFKSLAKFRNVVWGRGPII